MRLFSIRTVMPVLALLYACQLSAQNPANPIQVALLRWYQANTAAQISTCSSPSGMAFDGSHIWVACSTSTGEVQEFNASDGALVQTITGVETPYSLAYDGANIWVADYGYNAVTKINASTGAMSAPITVGTEPRGMAFDGTYIWVTNYGSNSLSKIMATTGVVINTYNFVSTVCEAPW